jgi:chromosome segregation ATPase
LAEEAKPFENIEDKFKLSLLQIEKRFVDLEVALGELNEKLKAVDVASISELKERVDDIEDLIMVEQAGIIELKKMLEENIQASQVAPVVANVPKEEIEKIISTSISNLQSQLEKTEKNIQSIINEISELRTEINNEITRIKERIGSSPLYADVQFITNRVRDLKNTVDSLLNMKVEVDSRILNLERSLVEISEEKGISPSVLKELENMKFKIEELEKTTQETLKVIKLNEKGLEEKVKTLSDIENTYSKFNQLYFEAQKNLQELTKVDLKIKDSMKIYEERLKNLENGLVEIKSLVQKKITPELIDKKVLEVENNLNITQQQISELNKKILGFEDRISVLETFTKDFDEKISKTELPIEIIDKQMNELLSKIIFLETKLEALERMLQQPAKVEPIILE